MFSLCAHIVVTLYKETPLLASSPPQYITGKEMAARVHLRAAMALGQQRRGRPEMRGQIVVRGGGRGSGGTCEVAPEQPASLLCEQERCVNFCLVPLSPSSSKWSTSTTLREREPGRGESGEVGGGVGVDEHLTQTPFVLRAGVCITMGLRGEMGGVYQKNTMRRPYCYHLLPLAIVNTWSLACCGHYLCSSFSTQ